MRRQAPIFSSVSAQDMHKQAGLDLRPTYSFAVSTKSAKTAMRMYLSAG
jgi:hypothetical protein